MAALVQWNVELVSSGTAISLADYIREASALSGFSEEPAFAQEILPLLASDNICIPHTLLVKYGVLSKDRFSAFETARIIGYYGFREGCDYTTRKVKSGGRGRPAKSYYLHPDAFELCLIRARNTREHAISYIKLRKLVASYERYQAAFRERQLTGELQQARQAEKKSTLELARLRAEAPPPRHATILYRRDEGRLDVGCLYFVHCAAADQFKIGFAHHLPARLADLQTGCPFPLALYRSVTCSSPASYEARAHEHFAAARRSGEWFAVTPPEIDAFIAELEL
jgi:hypothetical protein